MRDLLRRLWEFEFAPCFSWAFEHIISENAELGIIR